MGCYHRITDEPDERELGALVEAFVNRISHPRGRVLTFMAKASVTVPQVILLNFALKNPDSAPSSLAATMRVSLPSVSQMIERLVKLGLAQRTEDSEDRRRKMVSVTSKGRILLTRLEAVRAAEYAAGAANLSQVTRWRLSDALSQALQELAPRWRPGRPKGARKTSWRQAEGAESVFGLSLCVSIASGARLQFQRHTAMAAALDSTVLQSADDSFERRQGVAGPVRFTLFEVVPGLRHRVRDMSKTEHSRVCASRVGIESRSLHFNGKEAPRTSGFDRLSCFPKGSIGRPGCSNHAQGSALSERRRRRSHQLGVCFGIFRRRSVVVTRSLIAQCPVDDDEVRRRPSRNNLAGRSETDEQLAAAGEELFGNQHGKGRADRAPDNSNGLIRQLELVQFGVITRPGLEGLRRPGLAQLPNQVAVWVQDADGGH